MERSRTIFRRLCISSPAKSDYWPPYGCVRGLMAKAKNGPRFKNSSEAVCVFNTVCECVVIQPVKRNRKAFARVCGSHAYFSCRHTLIQRTEPLCVPEYWSSRYWRFTLVCFVGCEIDL